NHAVSEWPPRPIGGLRPFFQMDSQQPVDQTRQAELAETQQTRRQHCIENISRHEPASAAPQSQIVIGAVHDQFVHGKGPNEPREADSRSGVCGPQPFLQGGLMTNAGVLRLTAALACPPLWIARCPGEFKNGRKNRSRRGKEAEVFFAPKSASYVGGYHSWTHPGPLRSCGPETHSRQGTAVQWA